MMYHVLDFIACPDCKHFPLAYYMVGVNERIAYSFEKAVKKLRISRQLGSLLMAKCRRIPP